MTSMTRRSAFQVAAAALGALVAPATLAAQGSGLKFQIYKASGGFRWRLRAGNNQVLATSGEAYKAKADCRHGIDLIIRGAAPATVVDVP
jgi:uncharacterized protein YegP (UPF0339 family)